MEMFESMERRMQVPQDDVPVILMYGDRDEYVAMLTWFDKHLLISGSK
jgi:hypothetical protein